MKSNKLVLCVIVLFMAAGAWADYIIAESNSVSNAIDVNLTRLDANGVVLWSFGNNVHRGARSIEVNPDDGKVYVGYNNVDNLVRTINERDGSKTGRVVLPGNVTNDFQFGFDYDDDGVSDLWTVDDSTIKVFSGAKLNWFPNRGIEPLATFKVADTDPNSMRDGTGGSCLLFGPDKTSDGNAEIYIVKSDADDPNNRINVWDPYVLKTDPDANNARVASWPASAVRGAQAIIIGPDVDGGGLPDLWIASQYTDRIRAYSYVDGTDLGNIDYNAVILNPMDLENGPTADTVLVSTRFASSLDPDYVDPNTEVEGGNLLLLTCTPGTPNAVTTLIYESDKRINGVAYVEPLPPVVEPNTPYDIVVANYVNNSNHWLARYNPEPYLVWETIDARGYMSKIAVHPTDGTIYIGYGGTDNIIMEYDPNTGYPVEPDGGRRDPEGFNDYFANDNINSIEWGHDYNHDGFVDLWLVTRTGIMVLDGSDTSRHTRMTVLAALETTTNSNDPNGTGGWGMCFGPDITGDGIGEMYCGKGQDNSDTGPKHIVVWDPNRTLDADSEIARYDVTGLFAIRGMTMGPDNDGDGLDDMYIATEKGGYIAVVSIYPYPSPGYKYQGALDTGIYVGGVHGKCNPTGVYAADDGSIFITTRFASNFSENFVPESEVMRGNVLRFYNGDTTLVFEHSTDTQLRGGFVVMPPTFDICAGIPEEDLNKDCLVDNNDLAIFVSQWLDCTDPNTANCP